MVTTITIIFFVSKLCHLTGAILDPNLIHSSTINPNDMLSTSMSTVHFAQTNGNERPPQIDSLSQNRHILRDKRNVKRGEKNFVRLGRDGEDYSRYQRSEKNLIRFGRNDNSKGNGFIRLGRSEKGMLRFGRNDNSEAMRFGRRGDKFIRFFVAPNLNAAESSLQPSRSINRPGRTDKYIRFGRGDNGFVRLGRKDEDFQYAPDSTTSDDNDSEEKEENVLVDEDNNPNSMQLYYMLRKSNDLLPSGLDSVSPSTPLDDDYLMNFKLNYDKNSFKNNVL
ncbi:uncharacterized protein LOC119073934 isoform X2 [Bradysia coprophila]|uniref:uncharacterized protein LOC119073934 isoform X2 n=1 Tax=Bradysia coprophila TaxID=38358 RepID=UPI00187DB7D4|nr:uncharacterized protein LOC119073934 isoform X2 [Bradysia coprophila]